MATTHGHPGESLADTHDTPAVLETTVDTPGERRPEWLSYEEFPFTLRTIDLDGETVRYVDEGTGPTLLFVHAGPAWSLLFRDLIVDLRGDFRCLTLDFPGYGLSAEGGVEPASIPRIAALLTAFVDRLDLREITLVVHEIGTVAGFDLLRRDPDRIRGVVVLGGFAWSLADQPRIGRMLRFMRTPMFGVVHTWFDLLTRVTATRFGAGRRLSSEGRRVFRGPTRDRQVRRNVRTLLTSITDEETDAFLDDLDGSLVDVSVPVLLSFGENDPGRGDGFPERFRSHLPAVSEVVVPGANHFPMADAPHTIAAHVATWHDETVEGDS